MYIGRDVPHDSARGHVTGESIYVDDVPPQHGELLVDFVWSPYAHARIRSIARQATEQGIATPAAGAVDLSPLTAPEEQALIKRLLHYPEVVRGAARAVEPHRIAFWLQELAGEFHAYYKAHRVIQDDRRLTQARLALCAAVGQVVANGLDLLGVTAPETM